MGDSVKNCVRSKAHVKSIKIQIYSSPILVQWLHFRPLHRFHKALFPFWQNSCNLISHNNFVIATNILIWDIFSNLIRGIPLAAGSSRSASKRCQRIFLLKIAKSPHPCKAPCRLMGKAACSLLGPKINVAFLFLAVAYNSIHELSAESLYFIGRKLYKCQSYVCSLIAKNEPCF